MAELTREFEAFVNCELDDETVQKNLSNVESPPNDPPASPITTEAVEAAVERLASGSFDVVQRVLGP